MSSNVLNRFEQTPGPLGPNDNKLVLDGTVEISQSLVGTINFTITIDDASTATGANEPLVAPGFAGTVVLVTGAVTRPGFVGPEQFITRINAVNITNGDLNITTNDFAFSTVPTANNVFSATDVLKLSIAGGSTNAGSGTVTFEVRPL